MANYTVEQSQIDQLISQLSQRYASLKDGHAAVLAAQALAADAAAAFAVKDDAVNQAVSIQTQRQVDLDQTIANIEALFDSMK